MSKFKQGLITLFIVIIGALAATASIVNVSADGERAALRAGEAAFTPTTTHADNEHPFHFVRDDGLCDIVGGYWLDDYCHHSDDAYGWGVTIQPLPSTPVTGRRLPLDWTLMVSPSRSAAAAHAERR